MLFSDSHFLIAAWEQLLETKSPEEAVFCVGNRKIYASAVLDVLEGRCVDPFAVPAITEFLTAALVEAFRVVRGRFAAGLDNGGRPR